MAMNAADLAEETKSALGFVAEPTSAISLNFAAAFVTFMTTSTFTHLPGTIIGVCGSPGGPLSNGSASLGTMVSNAPVFKTALFAAFGQTTPQIGAFADAISAHFAAATVSFGIGDITGICGHTPTSPGPFVGQGANGFQVGLDKTILAATIAIAMGQGAPTPQSEDFCDALIQHVVNNAEYSYLPATVTGTCPATGAPLTLGAGVGGVIV